MAAIKKDHTLSSHWRGMMDDYLKVWQVLRWRGEGVGEGEALSILPWLPPSPLCLSRPLSAYLGQGFNTPLTWLYWHTPDSVWRLMSIWVPLSLFFSPSLFLSLSAPHLPVILFSLSERYSLAYLTHKPLELGWSHTHTKLTQTFHRATHTCIYTNIFRYWNIINTSILRHILVILEQCTSFFLAERDFYLGSRTKQEVLCHL